MGQFAMSVLRGSRLIEKGTTRFHFEEISLRVPIGSVQFYQITLSHLRPYPPNVHLVHLHYDVLVRPFFR
jgi:hypothetical protein